MLRRLATHQGILVGLYQFASIFEIKSVATLMDPIKEVLFVLVMAICLLEAATLKIIATTDSLDHFFILFHPSIEAALT